MLTAGLCWTPTDHVTPVALVLAVSEGLPAKRQGLESDGLVPGKESLGQARKVGTDCILQSPSAHTHFRGPSSSPETIPFEVGTMCDGSYLLVPLRLRALSLRRLPHLHLVPITFPLSKDTYSSA